MKIIDPHLHLFDLAKGNYLWLKADNPPYWPDKASINQNYDESDIRLTAPFELAGFVHIEAGFNNTKPWQEIAWLEDQVTLPFKSVANTDLTLPRQQFSSQLDKLTTYSSVVGVRHILDDDALEILQHKNTQDNLSQLIDRGLHFELQMPVSNTQSINTLTRLLKLMPKLKIVINHCGWPVLPTASSSGDKLWLEGLKRLAEFSQVFIKCSGWEMMARNYQGEDVKNIVAQVLAAFTTEKVMLASNFPLTLFSHSYQELWQIYRDKLGLNIEQFTMLTYQNTKAIYHL